MTVTAGYWFTSSTFFANPAVTLARSFTDTFVGIAPADVLGFVLAQVMAALVISKMTHTIQR
jgi:glycerol uptake facilitator-like aquaporin